MDILKKTGDGYVIVSGKNSGKTLEQMAEERPNFLVFLFKKCADRMPEEAFYVVADLLAAKGYDLANLKYRKGDEDNFDPLPGSNVS